jgi:hypothetical protein
VSGRGKIDRNGIAGVRRVSNRLNRQKLGNRKTRHPQQMPGRASAIVIANDFDSHGFLGKM